MTSRLLRTRDVAELLGIAEQTLALWRGQGRGPPFVRIESAIRYPEDQLQRYLQVRAESPLPAGDGRPARLVA